MLSKNTLHCTRRLNSSSNPSSRCWIVLPRALSSRCARDNASPSLCQSLDDKVAVVPSASSQATRALFFRNALATHVGHLVAAAPGAWPPPPRRGPARPRLRAKRHGRAELVLHLLGARGPRERLRVLVHAGHGFEQSAGHRRCRGRRGVLPQPAQRRYSTPCQAADGSLLDR
jgi:hypothetical protein